MFVQRPDLLGRSHRALFAIASHRIAGAFLSAFPTYPFPACGWLDALRWGISFSLFGYRKGSLLRKLLYPWQALFGVTTILHTCTLENQNPGGGRSEAHGATHPLPALHTVSGLALPFVWAPAHSPAPLR